VDSEGPFQAPVLALLADGKPRSMGEIAGLLGLDAGVGSVGLLRPFAVRFAAQKRTGQ
jgi:hypothetical protein